MEPQADVTIPVDAAPPAVEEQRRGPGRPPKNKTQSSEPPSLPAPAEPEKEEEMLVKVRLVADPPNKKALNIVRKYVKPHPAICMTPGCGKDLMREYVAKHRKKRDSLGNTYAKTTEWEDIPSQIQEGLIRAMKKHAMSHDSGDYGMVRKSQVKSQKPWLGDRKGLK